MQENSYGQIDNRAVTTEDFIKFAKNQQNDKRTNERKGNESALKKVRIGSKLLLNSKK